MSSVYAQDLAIQGSVKTDYVKVVSVERLVRDLVGEVSDLLPSSMGSEGRGRPKINCGVGIDSPTHGGKREAGSRYRGCYRKRELRNLDIRRDTSAQHDSILRCRRAEYVPMNHYFTVLVSWRSVGGKLLQLKVEDAFIVRGKDFAFGTFQGLG